MMGNDQTISQDLYDLLTTQNFDPEVTDQQGKASQSNEGQVFKFDYVSGTDKNYGTAVLVIGEDNDLMFFFGDNLGKSMEEPDKTEWFKFLQHLSQFATEHRYTWSPKDLNRFKHTMAGMAAIKEGLFEGYYGTRKKSYVGEPTEARLVINHNRMIGENDKRYRYVESLFIETVDGERFKLPFTKLAGGNAMLEHVRQGGKPYDIRGTHITDIVNEMAVLGRFNRARQNRVFEGVTQELVEQAANYYQSLKENLKHLTTSRGYQKYFESWSPADITTEEALVEDLKTLFVEQSIDARIEAALPTLAKIQQGAKMKEADIFESWINNLSEGTWALPDNPEAQAKLDELMSKELVVGPDATNATEQLYDVVGDDQLFDILGDLAERDPRANVWDDTDVQRRLEELGIQLNTTPAAMQQPEVTPPAGDAELTESHMAEVDLILQDVASGDEDIYRVYTQPRTKEEAYAAKIIGDMYDEVVIDQHLHADDDIEKILDIVADQLEQKYSLNEADNLASFVEQGVAEGIFDIFKKLPTSGSTVKIAGRPVEITHAGANSDYIGYTWTDKNGKEHYEETLAREHSNLRSLANMIADEIKYADDDGVDDELDAQIKGRLDRHFGKNKDMAEGSSNVRYKAHPTKKTHVVVTQVPTGHKGIKVGDEIARSDIKGWKGFSAERKKQGVAEDLTNPNAKPDKVDRKKEPNTRSERYYKNKEAKKKQGVTENEGETTDVYRTVVKKAGKPIGEVGIDLEASPGSGGDWYMKHYASKSDMSGFASKKEALEELKYYHNLSAKGYSEAYDPSYDPDYRPYQKPEQDPDAWKQDRDLEEPSTPTTVTIRDAEGNVVLQFPSTGGFYGDKKYALSKGFDTDTDYVIKWKKDVAEDGSNEMSGRDGVWDSFYESDELARIKQLALLK